MSLRLISWLMIGIWFLLPACTSGTARLRSGADAVAEVSALLSGSYSSAAQARSDPEYVEVHLHMVPIWHERHDGPWFYVEQALGTALAKPYRQRFYRLVADAPGVISEVYTLPGDPLVFAGAWREPERLAALTPSQLALRAGCEIHLQPQADGSYAESTSGGKCPSDLRGSTYATSEVRLNAQALRSWDRGFSDDGQQVWGAVNGPYVFDRLPD